MDDPVGSGGSYNTSDRSESDGVSRSNRASIVTDLADNETWPHTTLPNPPVSLSHAVASRARVKTTCCETFNKVNNAGLSADAEAPADVPAVVPTVTEAPCGLPASPLLNAITRGLGSSDEIAAQQSQGVPPPTAQAVVLDSYGRSYCAVVGGNDPGLSHSEADVAAAAGIQLTTEPGVTAADVRAGPISTVAESQLDGANAAAPRLACAKASSRHTAEATGVAEGVCARAVFDACKEGRDPLDDALVAFLGGGVHLRVNTAVVFVVDEPPLQGRVCVANEDDRSAAQCQAQRMGVSMGRVEFVLDDHICPAGYVTASRVQVAMDPADVSAVYARNLAADELYRCLPGVILEHWAARDYWVAAASACAASLGDPSASTHSDVPVSSSAAATAASNPPSVETRHDVIMCARVPGVELEGAQCVVARIMSLLGSKITVIAVPGADENLGFPPGGRGKVVLMMPQSIPTPSIAGYENTSLATVSQHDGDSKLETFTVLDDECHAALATDSEDADSEDYGASTLSCYVFHDGALHVITTGHDARPATGGACILRPALSPQDSSCYNLLPMHIMEPRSPDFDSLFLGARSALAFPHSTPPPSVAHGRPKPKAVPPNTMIADVSISRVDDVERYLRHRLLTMLSNSCLTTGGAQSVALPPWDEYSGQVEFEGRNELRAHNLPRMLDVVGYTEKRIEGVVEGSIAVAVMQNYIAVTSGGKPPNKGDSGGPVFQTCSGGSRRLHSFIRARAITGDGATRRTFYTLTPAHFALEQVRTFLDQSVVFLE